MFKLGHNAMKAIKNICCMKNEGKVDHNTVTRWLKKFHSSCKNVHDQGRLGRSKTVDSKVVFQNIETNPVSTTQRVSSKFSIPHSSGVHHFLDLGKSI